MDIGYTTFRYLFGFFVDIFFEEISVIGEIPKTGPVIVAGNHNNAVVDGAIICSKIDRQIHFMGKATLFRSAILRPLLKCGGIIPVHRKQDQLSGQRVDNTESLKEAIKILQQNKCFGIFPEGISHNNPYLCELKKGIAYISIDAITKKVDPNIDIIPTVSIIPTGLNYLSGGQFQSKCVLYFGDPIIVSPGDSVDDIMNRLKNGLKKVMMDAQNEKIRGMADTALNLYLSKNINLLNVSDYVRIKINFLRAYSVLKDDILFSTKYNKIKEYHESLYSLGIDDDIVRNKYTKWNSIPEFIKLCFGTILYLPCLLINFPTIVAIKAATKKFSKKDDMTATVKITATALSWVGTYMIYITMLCIYSHICNNGKMFGMYLGKFIMSFLSSCVSLTYVGIQ